MTKLVTLVTTGRDLSADLAASLEHLSAHGPEWLAEVARLRGLYRERCPGAGLEAVVIHPSMLPNEERLDLVHFCLEEVCSG